MLPIKMMLISIVSVVVFLGLAIIGGGGPAAFFSHPALVALTAITLVLMVAAFFTAGNLSSGEREDRSNRWVLIVFSILGLLVAWLPAYADHKDIWTLDGESLRWVGVTVYAIGGALRLWPVFALGNRFSGLVAIQRDHRLVTSGIYGIIRHPSYLGLLITVFGWALAFRSGVGIVLALSMLVPVVGRIRAEEALLLDKFGPEYSAYRARTARLIPGLY